MFKHSSIVLARKPLSEKSIAENVLKHGTGGLNIDGSRIEFNGEKDPSKERYNYIRNVDKMFDSQVGFKKTSENIFYDEKTGRFPANLMFDEEAGKVLDEQSDRASRFFYKTKQDI